MDKELSNLKKLLREYLKELNIIIFNKTEMYLYNDKDIEEVLTCCTDLFCEEFLLDDEISPFCFYIDIILNNGGLIVGECSLFCGYGKRHGICYNKGGSDYKKIEEKMGNIKKDPNIINLIEKYKDKTKKI